MASISKLQNGRWRARYRDDTGRQIARHFERKLDARRWLDEVTASIVTGQYVDPKAGQVAFQDYAEQWRHAQVHRPTSAAHVKTMLARHVYPTFGARPISAILPNDIQTWVKRLSTKLAPSTVKVIHGIVSTIMRSAVRDRRIVANPCDGTRLPKATPKRVQPLTTEQVRVLRDHLPTPLRALVTFTAGTGLRQGEVFGLTRDRLDLERGFITVDRQLITMPGCVPQFGPPKTAASVRSVPLPKVVIDAMTEQIARYPVDPEALVFTHEGLPLTRQGFGHLWRPAARAAGLTPMTGTGMHALRHYYASLLIRHGESVKVVQARLGHASAAETLDTYSHLWPDSDDRTREAIDAVLGSDDNDQTSRTDSLDS